MQIFKTSGNTFASVIANECHAFKHHPRMQIGEIVLISKNRTDLRKGEKQIAHYAILDEISETTNEEIERLWPGNAGRWKFIVRFACVVELDAPFDLADVLGDARAKHYRPVVTSAPVGPEDAEKIEKLIHTIKREEIRGTEFEFGVYREGAATTVLVNRFERDPRARIACIRKHGYSCKICGDSLAKKYGELGEQFIHVHHLVPTSLVKREYIIDPEKDLIPVCPNCHAMLHRTNPPITPDDLRSRIR
jgi:5-methylcytosine-specific restriction enzyme A